MVTMAGEGIRRTSECRYGKEHTRNVTASSCPWHLNKIRKPWESVDSQNKLRVRTLDRTVSAESITKSSKDE
jgi:hypothetical protein